MVNIVTNILFATDFSPCSVPAFRYAVEWAKVFDAQLTLFHGLSLQPGLDIDAGIAQRYLDEQRKVGEEHLNQLLAEARQQVPKTAKEMRTGLASAQICDVARECKADLIITGTHGWTGFNRVVFGSIAERVIQRAPCPVLSIPDRSPEETAGMHALTIQPRQIVLPIDFSDCSMDAYEYAVEVAKWFDAPLTLVCAIEPLSYSLDFSLTHPLEDKANRKKVVQRLEELTKLLVDEGLSAHYELVEKPSVEAIMETSATQQADLVVMGTHGRKGLSRLLLGSTTAKILQLSPYPILTVKSPKFEGGHHPATQSEQPSASATTGNHSDA
ncbi:MAG: universal stress protein [Nitrospirota bacterium]|nr:universal stress protein [Nitrospirota bacterium]MDH5773305.1 universal stress protein [Nitrospirota bacterium]